MCVSVCVLLHLLRAIFAESYSTIGDTKQTNAGSIEDAQDAVVVPLMMRGSHRVSREKLPPLRPDRQHALQDRQDNENLMHAAQSASSPHLRQGECVETTQATCFDRSFKHSSRFRGCALKEDCLCSASKRRPGLAADCERSISGAAYEVFTVRQSVTQSLSLPSRSIFGWDGWM